MTSVSKVNKSIKSMGINGRIIKGKGYYYFIGDLFDKVKSLYTNNLYGWETEEIINRIKEDLENGKQ